MRRRASARGQELLTLLADSLAQPTLAPVAMPVYPPRHGPRAPPSIALQHPGGLSYDALLGFCSLAPGMLDPGWLEAKLGAAGSPLALRDEQVREGLGQRCSTPWLRPLAVMRLQLAVRAGQERARRRSQQRQAQRAPATEAVQQAWAAEEARDAGADKEALTTVPVAGLRCVGCITVLLPVRQPALGA
jgi:hypothetical protein